MKIVLCLTVALALLQDGLCRPTPVESAMESASTTCVSRLKLDTTVLTEQLSQSIIPEDNKEAAEYYTCFSKLLTVQNEAGDVDFHILSLVVQEMIEVGMEMLDNKDEDSNDARIFADSAVEHCKSSVTHENGSLNVLRLRNCLFKYIQNSDTYF